MLLTRIFQYHPHTFQLLKTFKDPFSQGWGLTADPNQRYMVASDGRATLFFLNENCTILKKLKVSDNGMPVNDINELEWIGDRIWANVNS